MDDDERILDFFFPNPNKKQVESPKKIENEPAPLEDLGFYDRPPPSTIYQNNQEIYEKRRLERQNISILNLPEDGLPVFIENENLNFNYKISIYNRYNFKHKYDMCLPVTRVAKNLIGTIDHSPVTVVCGSTGSGKTTQIPQLILDHHRTRDEHCNIIVTQPRRIAAISVARRVASERNWQVGEVVGYSVAHDKQTSPETRICYCTVGVLIERIIIDISILKCYTHVIVDEIHERSEEIDLLLLILNRYMKETSKHLRVVLMSATLDVNLFSKYFSQSINQRVINAPVINVEGRSYDVKVFHLCQFDFIDLKQQRKLSGSTEPSYSNELQELIIRIIINLTEFECKHLPHIDRSEGAVLVFLPGIPEVEECYKRLKFESQDNKLALRVLHSQISLEDQVQIFRKVEKGWRKIILATNIAESSITVPDVRYVVDSCLHKQLECDKNTGLSCLKLDFVSKASAEQRKGRAGRINDGYCFRLVTKSFYEDLPTFSIPEMKRCSLDQLVLKVKRLDIGPPPLILQEALDPPNMFDIKRTFLKLKQVGALTLTFNGIPSSLEGELTFLGEIMASLPIDIKMSKFIVFANIFGLLDEAVVIAAMLSVRNVFIRKIDGEYDEYYNKMLWSCDTFSDHVVYLELYRTKRKWANDNCLNLKALAEADSVVSDIFQRLYNFNIFPHKKLLERCIIRNDETLFLLKIALASAFYPHYFISSSFSFSEQAREYANKNLFNTVMVSGLDRNENNKRQITSFFGEKFRIKKIEFESCRAYIEFDAIVSKKILASPFVYLSIKKRNIESGRKVYLSSNAEISSKKHFSGPYSPLELKFGGMPNLISIRSVRIHPSSVNSVFLYSYPNENLTFTLIGTDCNINDSKSSIRIRNCTAMPPFNGLSSLLVLLFSTCCEFRFSDDFQNIVGALCGLGYDHDIQQPFFPDDDIEVHFTFEFTKDDMKLINSIRKAFNFLLVERNQEKWDRDFINKYTKSVKKDILSIFKVKRPYIDPVEISTPSYKWNVIPDELLIPNIDEPQPLYIYKPHEKYVLN